MALGTKGNKRYNLARNTPPSPSFEPLSPFPRSPSSSRGVTSGHITAFIWIGCIFALLLFIIVTEGGPTSPTSANGTPTYEMVRIEAVGEDYVLVSNGVGVESKLRFPTLLTAIQNGEVKLGDQIRVKRK